jgi:hypothetical protein
MSKIEAFWENATADDVAKIANTRKSIQARFRDEDNEDWVDCLLVGWKLSKHLPGAVWIDADGASWSHCQVYREPSYWTERPDPGPGRRLLGKFPDEELKPGDECFTSTGAWEQSFSATIGERQSYGMWYRRRIEPVEPKFAVGQTVKVVGPKEIPALEWSSVGMAQYAGTTQAIERVKLLTNPPGTYYHLKGIVNWCFREDYLEPVEPVESKPLLIRRRVVEIGDEIKLPNGRVLVFNGEGFEVKQ